MDANTTLFLPANSEVLRVLAPLPRQGAVSPSRQYATVKRHESNQTGTQVQPTTLARPSPAPEERSQ